jgi:hypothetical protein
MTIEKTASDVYTLLTEIKGDVGEMKATLAITASTLSQHVQDDKALTGRVNSLELTHARQVGAARVWGMVGGAAGSAILAVLGWLFGSPRH